MLVVLPLDTIRNQMNVLGATWLYGGGMCLFTQCHGIRQVATVDLAGSRRPLLAFIMLATLTFPLGGGRNGRNCEQCRKC